MKNNIIRELKKFEVEIHTLSKDPANARLHDEKNLDAIRSSLAKFGQRTPIVVQKEGMIVRAGNGRLEAARSLGWDKIAALVVDDDNVTATAYAIADNRTGELATWDDDVLGTIIKNLDEELRIGFDEKELNDLIRDIPDVGFSDDDEVPDPPSEPRTSYGDQWILGNHRLLCGDSTNIDEVKRFVGDDLADVVFTDPPYGVQVSGGQKKNTNAGKIQGDQSQTVIPFSFDVAVNVATKEKARLYFCGGESNLMMYLKLFDRHLKSLPRHLIWIKESFVMKPNGYHNQYEIIYYGFKDGGGGLSSWYGGRTEDEASDVWKIARDLPSTRVHPTQKPVEVPERAIKNSCPPGGIVFEPFGGSGSTLIACEKNARKCLAIEIDPKFCDVIVERWEKYTGKKAAKQVEKNK